MDRRQQKTREAIFHAFSTLLEKKSYNHITVQEILDTANIGRSTFYAHFETKDELLTHIHGLYSNEEMPQSVFCHLLQHLQENDNNILGLLSCESSEIFLRYFKDSLNELVQTQFINHNRKQNQELPQEFLVNHISGSFVEMVLWWLKDKKKHTPEELDYYFRAVIEPIL